MHDLGCDFFDGHLWICPFPSSSLFPFPWACHVRVVLYPVLYRAVARGVFLATRAVHAVPALSREVSPARFCRGSCEHLGSCQVFLLVYHVPFPSLCLIFLSLDGFLCFV